MRAMSNIARFTALALLFATSAFAEDSKWAPLFNGKDLTGWTIKIAKRSLGDGWTNLEEYINKADSKTATDPMAAQESNVDGNLF